MRDGGGTIGGHISLLGSRFGITASVLQARTLTSGIFVDGTGATVQFPTHDLRSIFFALQPNARLPIAKVLEAHVAVGPSWTDVDELGTDESVDEWLGVALSVDTVAPPFDAAGWGASLAASIGFELSPRARAQFRVAENVSRVESLRAGASGHVQHDIQLSMGVSVVLVN